MQVELSMTFFLNVYLKLLSTLKGVCVFVVDLALTEEIHFALGTFSSQVLVPGSQMENCLFILLRFDLYTLAKSARLTTTKAPSNAADRSQI